MGELLLLAGFGVGALLIVVGWQSARVRQAAHERTTALLDDSALPEPQRAEARSILGRWYPWPWLVGLALGSGLYFLTPAGKYFSPAIGLLAALLLDRVDAWRVSRRSLLLEQQLANVLDLLIGALRAGSSLLPALDTLAREAKAPLQAQLEEVVGRIRYGDNPQAVLETLATRIPLETFQLFTQTLSVHWEVGGSLAGPLASVTRTIRDRVELSRRLYALTMQSRLTILMVMGVTYFIGLLMWRNNPERMESFVRHEAGQAMLAACLALQALGVAWVSALSRVRF